MVYRARINYSAKQRADIWDRWQKGESLCSIGRLFDRHSSSIFGLLAPTGGIRPPARNRSKLALTLSEREEISRGIASSYSLRKIAAILNRSPSTISREIARNGGYDSYRAAKAEQAAWERAHRPKQCKLACYPMLKRIVAIKLKRKWSPKQISGWLKRTYPFEARKQVSHETIYRSLFIQARGVLKKELQQYLRSQRAIRRARKHSIKSEGLSKITNTVSISERPASVEDRAVPGHWEGDLISGSNNTHIATLVERHSRYAMLVKVKGKDTETVISALIKHAKKLPTELYKSLTWDRGKEMADHQRFTLATNIDVYFCDPQSPWQRGTNENTNRLLRQYFPKGTDLSVHSQATLNKVARELNERPRETLEFETPAERFNACVASTG
jgi:transposase, IS30 family